MKWNRYDDMCENLTSDEIITFIETLQDMCNNVDCQDESVDPLAALAQALVRQRETCQVERS